MYRRPKNITVHFFGGKVSFNGKYRRDLETKNWHYYEKTNGRILHFKKEHMTYVEGNRLAVYTSKNDFNLDCPMTPDI